MSRSFGMTFVRKILHWLNSQKKPFWARLAGVSIIVTILAGWDPAVTKVLAFLRVGNSIQIYDDSDSANLSLKLINNTDSAIELGSLIYLYVVENGQKITPITGVNISSRTLAPGIPEKIQIEFGPTVPDMDYHDSNPFCHWARESAYQDYALVGKSVFSTQCYARYRVEEDDVSAAGMQRWKEEQTLEEIIMLPKISCMALINQAKKALRRYNRSCPSMEVGNANR